MKNIFLKGKDSVQQIKVKILDHEYVLKSDEDAEEVYRVAEYVNETLKKIGETTEGLTEKKRAILASLYIAGEYFQVLKERDKLLNRIQERTDILISHINDVMG